MKKIALDLILLCTSKRLYPVICLIMLTVSLQAQTVRYLQKKNYQGEEFKNMTTVGPTISDDNRKFAIYTLKTEYSEDFKKMRYTHSAKIINLTNGRLELNQNGLLAYYRQNKLIVDDYSKMSDQWFETSQLAAKLATVSQYQLLENNERKAIPLSKPPALPNGYALIFSVGKYWICSDGQSWMLALGKSGQFEMIHRFDLQTAQISSDSTKLFGYNKFTPDRKIKVYDILSGKLLHSIAQRKNESLGVVEMFRDGRLLYTYTQFKGASAITSAKIVSPEGRTLKEFNTEVAIKISESERELFSIFNGTIKFYDVSSGQILAETKDTYINKGDFLTAGLSSITTLKINDGDFYLIPYSSGIMSLLSIKERKVVANIFTDMEDWAVIAKDGRIDGTQGAFEKLEWREYDGDNIVRTASVESSFDKYYTPRLLYTILSGDESEPLVNAVKTVTIDEDMKQVPVLDWLNVNDKIVTREVGKVTTYNSMQKSITLRLKVTANMDRIKEVRLYHNGKLVGNQPANGTASYTFNASLNSVFGDANSIYAIASTTDGLDSEKCKLTVTYSEKDKAKPKLYALVVGINKYQNPRYELNYALPDATAIKNQLEKGGSTLFESIVVKTLFEGQATKANVINAFKEISSTVQEQDMFIFYYAGHGTMSEPPANEFYIVPQDVTQLYGNEGILKDKAISASEIKKLSMAIHAQKQVFIIDACHSAGALNSAVTRGATEEKAIGQLARSTGTFWLTAAGSDQFATEFAQLGHGVFTFSLLEALQGKDAATITDGSLTIRELSTYIEQRVPELSAKYKGSAQYPASFSFGNDFPILIFGSKN